MSASAPSPRPAVDAEAWGEAESRLEDWFSDRGWSPFDYQRDVWRAYRDGDSGLVHAPTGTGKTYSVWFAVLIEWMAEQIAAGRNIEAYDELTPPPLSVLWVTPLRALSHNTVTALQRAARDLRLPWRIEGRTGDTSYRKKKGQLSDPPSALITTPESLSILLSYPDTKEHLQNLRMVVVDEWHELMGSKRGVQAELGIARLRRWNPDLRTWGLSATIGNMDEARDTLLGEPDADGRLITADIKKDIQIDALLPEDVHRFPWAGNLGLQMLDHVLSELDTADSALVFTNTRAQAEQWYRAILDARPEWAGHLALHYGSLSRKQREVVEDGLANGRLRCVVCTSTLDLGVDFTPVDRVFQVGSPKGVARLLQRAGRSGHQPGATSRVTGVPSHSLQLIEYAAARDAMEADDIEARPPVRKPIDLLVQHVITIAIGSGFFPDDLFEEIRSAYSYRNLTRNEFDWAVRCASTGGSALKAYEKYHRIEKYDGDLERYRGMYVGTSDRLARRHRMMIGTITSDSSVEVRYKNGHTIGQVEETFISRLKHGDIFNFAGKTLEFLRIEDMKAVVQKAKSEPDGVVPRWLGGRLPLSNQLSHWIRRRLDEAAEGTFRGPEMAQVQSLMELQGKWSIVPTHDDFLVERVHSREGHHLFMYPFAGRPVHQGLASLLAYRMAEEVSISFTMSYNDYGFELLSPEPAPLRDAIAGGLFDTENLTSEIEASLNESEMSRRQFREIARVAGLVFTGYPGQPKSLGKIQASSGLIFDVLEEYESENPLLEQARREVRERQLEEDRLRDALDRIRDATLHVIDVPRMTPLAFPIYVDRLRDRISSEPLAQRVRRMQEELEEAARWE
ncbi:DNA ligase-associated DEXH box helicase [Longibacter salinarum]|uniref:DNA ligase-associated DEXH box helicase n=1 Tax=Longibacter salinarum TaxID=1850348 RepID=A0A2A8CTV5_9BACT|nr:ligase-associated DNA damage response DEXH box helicase [Longibacter salinarum]PEN11167.1 DNA ligase-associated DEXH box helicase [Longibacter salinarum]